MGIVCVVCTGTADVYCHNDEAYLCSTCDELVHSAHVLAASHHRVPVNAAPAPKIAPSSEEMSGVVPQDFLAFPDKMSKDNLPGVDNLSFSDDAWFAVPDSASNADSRAGGKAGVVKDFGYDDLFDLDAALEDDMAFALDRGLSSGMLADCLVPDAADAPLTDEEDKHIQTAKSRHIEANTSSSLSPASLAPFRPTLRTTATVAASCQGPAPAPAPAPAPGPATATGPTSYPYCVQPPISDTLSTSVLSVPNVDCYIPQSLLPVDPVVRAHMLTDRREKVQRFREKKKNRQFKKLIRYASRKRYAEVRPRIKGRFARKDEIAAAKAAGVPLTC